MIPPNQPSAPSWQEARLRRLEADLEEALRLARAALALAQEAAQKITGVAQMAGRPRAGGDGRTARYALTTSDSVAISGTTLGTGTAQLADVDSYPGPLTFSGDDVEYYTNTASTPDNKVILLTPLEGGGWAEDVEACP